MFSFIEYVFMLPNWLTNFRLVSLSTTNGVGVLGEHCSNVTHVIEVVLYIIISKIVSKDCILDEDIHIMFPIVR